MSALSITEIAEEEYLKEICYALIKEIEEKCLAELKRLRQKANAEETKKINSLIDEIINTVEAVKSKLKDSRLGSIQINKIQSQLEDITERAVTAAKKIEKDMGIREVEKVVNQLEKLEKRETEVLNLISRVKGIPVEELKTLPEENIELLKEEVKLLIKKEKEEKKQQPVYRALLNAYSKTVSNKELKMEIESLMKSNKITKEDIQEIKQKVAEYLTQEKSKAVKKELIEQLLLEGYAIEDEKNEIIYLETPEKNYKVMIKVSNGKITSKFVKLVEKENYRPTEYEKAKDKEKMIRWCTDYERIKKKIEEKGLKLKDKKTIYEIDEEVNYVFSKTVKSTRKKEKEVRNAVDKRD